MRLAWPVGKLNFHLFHNATISSSLNCVVAINLFRSSSVSLEFFCFLDLGSSSPSLARLGFDLVKLLLEEALITDFAFPKFRLPPLLGFLRKPLGLFGKDKSSSLESSGLMEFMKALTGNGVSWRRDWWWRPLGAKVSTEGGLLKLMPMWPKCWKNEKEYHHWSYHTWFLSNVQGQWYNNPIWSSLKPDQDFRLEGLVLQLLQLIWRYHMHLNLTFEWNCIALDVSVGMSGKLPRRGHCSSEATWARK